MKRLHLIPTSLVSLWLGMLAIAAYTIVVGWFASLDLGEPTFLRMGLVMLGATLGLVADDLCRFQRWKVACRLHFEDVIDGVCPDLDNDISDAAVWRWYMKQGKPWRIDPKRARPHVRFSDKWDRMEDYNRALARLRERRRSPRK